MGIGPVPAVRKALEKAGLGADRDRPVRAERGLRRPEPGRPARAEARPARRSTSTAAPSRSAIRSAPRARASWSRCSTRCARGSCATAWPASASGRAGRGHGRRAALSCVPAGPSSRLLALAGLAWAAKVAREAGAPPAASARRPARRRRGGRARDPAPADARAGSTVRGSLLVLLALWIFPVRLRPARRRRLPVLRAPPLAGRGPRPRLRQRLRRAGREPVISVQGEVTSRAPIGLALLWLPAFVVVHAARRSRRPSGAPLAGRRLRPALPGGGHRRHLHLRVRGPGPPGGVLRRRFGRGGRAARRPRALARHADALLHGRQPLHVPRRLRLRGHAVRGRLAARARRRRPRATGLLAGLAGGLMSLVRVQDAVLLALPARSTCCAAARRACEGPRGFLRRTRRARPPAGRVWARLYGFGFAGVVTQQNLVGGRGPHLLELMFSAAPRPLHLDAALPARRARVAAVAGPGRTARRRSSRRLRARGARQQRDAGLVGTESFGQRRMLGLTPLFGLGLRGRRSPSCAGAAPAPARCSAPVLALWNLSSSTSSTARSWRPERRR